jgi:hypothetical protein
VGGNKIYVKAGTYSVTSATANTSGGCVTLAATPTASTITKMVGYNASRGDGGTKPILRASGITAFTLITMGTASHLENLEIDGNSLTTSRGVAFVGTLSRAVNCKGENCTNSAFHATTNGNWLFGCEATGCATANAILSLSCYLCWAHGNTITAFGLGLNGNLAHSCVSSGNTGASTDGFGQTSAANGVQFINCTAYGNGRDGFRFTAGTIVKSAVNCLAVGNTGTGFNTTATDEGAVLYNCATQGNTGGDVSASLTNQSAAALTGDPFVASGSNNFALAANAAGTACRAAGLGAFPTGATTSYPDIGAAQHPDRQIHRPMLTGGAL